ncbi:unnamed protein product [Triticum turgidum subsp. durum]|uniref:PPPDE domain-containing protein n=1 Tax=Triticum turgidum subsp. durum TaxID=4567 RepID=A0A9R1BQL3_TRITD|nr:unnamed protein product [Triticum turgidum subsp. durum]
MPNGIVCLLGLLPRFWLSMGPSMLPSQIVPKMLANRLESSFTKLLAINFWQSTHVHGSEYSFGAHDLPTSGVFEVEPKSCPGFLYRSSIFIGLTSLHPLEFRDFIQRMASEYHGDTYHLISKNCNHFTDDLSTRLTGKPIPGWVNRLAKLGNKSVLLIHLFVATF